MTYKIAVCDDSSQDVLYISGLVSSWAENNGFSIEIRTFGSAEEFLFQYSEEKDFDILLLDIEMGKTNGVELAREVRRDNDAVQIVFITGYSDYIAEGYDVSALHYLMKPVNAEKLSEILFRAVQKLRKNERALLLEVSGEAVRVPLYEIKYLDVRQNYTTVHAKQDFTVKRTLSELEDELDERFYRLGRSAILNLHTIQRITKTDVYLSDGTVLPLPRGHYVPLNRALIALK